MDPTPSDWCPYEKRYTETHREKGSVEIEAKIGAMSL